MAARGGTALLLMRRRQLDLRGSEPRRTDDCGGFSSELRALERSTASGGGCWGTRLEFLGCDFGPQLAAACKALALCLRTQKAG